MFLAMKLVEKTWTEPLKDVPCEELAVSFHAIAVDVKPCPWNVTFVLGLGTVTFSLMIANEFSLKQGRKKVKYKIMNLRYWTERDPNWQNYFKIKFLFPGSNSV